MIWLSSPRTLYTTTMINKWPLGNHVPAFIEHSINESSIYITHFMNMGSLAKCIPSLPFYRSRLDLDKAYLYSNKLRESDVMCLTNPYFWEIPKSGLECLPILCLLFRFHNWLSECYMIWIIIWIPKQNKWISENLITKHYIDIWWIEYNLLNCGDLMMQFRLIFDRIDKSHIGSSFNQTLDDELYLHKQHLTRLWCDGWRSELNKVYYTPPPPLFHVI